MIRTTLALLLATALTTCTATAAEPTSQPQPVKHAVTGLFCQQRETDLSELVAMLPGIEVSNIDYSEGVAVFLYDAPTLFPGAKPEQVIQRLNNLLGQASNRTFGIKPLTTLPREKLQFLEIPVAGLDCLACSYGAYRAIYQLEGVEQATASFKTGKVTAWIDPAKTDQAKLEAALEQRGVTLVKPEE